MQRWRKKKLILPNGLQQTNIFYVQLKIASAKMNRIILQLFAVGFCFALGQALQCYDCKIGFYKLCFTTKKTCDAGEHCFSGVGEAAGFLNVKMKGCLKEAECNMTKEVNFPNSDSNATVYMMTKTCCNTDLCNAAPGLPGSAGLSLTLASITALYLAHILV